MLGDVKRYRIRALDVNEEELYNSGQIDGLSGEPSKDGITETVVLNTDDGVIRLETESPVIFLEVRYAGGALGNRIIGRCKIHRHDPRSSQLWPYALTAKDGDMAGCGIELMLVEGGEDVPRLSSARSSPSRLGTRTLDPQSQAAAVGAMWMPGSLEGIPAPADDILAALRVHTVEDLPAHKAAKKGSKDVRQQIIVSFEDIDKPGVSLAEAGPFNTEDQGSAMLRDAVCIGRQALAVLKAPYLVGGEAKEGAMFITAKVWYLTAGESRDFVGQTDAITVNWEPKKETYHELRARHDSPPIGGIVLSYRLSMESEVLQGGGLPAEMNIIKPKLQRVPTHVSGRSGRFPPGSPEEAYDHAILNYQAQNRANIQRIKAALPVSEGCQDETGAVRVVRGYREWRDMDSLFSSLGPSPLIDDDSIGAGVTRAYIDRSSVMAEVGPKLAAARQGTTTPADTVMDRRLISLVHDGNPEQMETKLRPEPCQDPQFIAQTRDMRWCPDPPMYSAIHSMSEDDKETLRLARYRPDQTSKLWFNDANPNYNMKQDIWGIVEDHNAARSALVAPGLFRHKRRVKDDCLLS